MNRALTANSSLSGCFKLGGITMVKDYVYAETVDRNTPPDGDGWEYWSDRITPDEHVAVWRRVRQDDDQTQD